MKQSIDPYLAELTATWETRRCVCGGPPSVVCIGDAPVYASGILVSRGRDDRNYCLECAAKTWANLPVERRGRR